MLVPYTRLLAIALRQFFNSTLVPYLRFLQLCFANSSILRWFRTIVLSVLFTYCIETLAFALRQFSNSTLVRFSKTSHICASPILRFYAGFALEIVPVASVFRQFFDSMLVRICFAGFANSSILSLVPLAESCTRSLCRSSRRYSVFKVYIFQVFGFPTSLLVTLKYTPLPLQVNRFSSCLLLFLCTENTTPYNAFTRESCLAQTICAI